MSIRLPATVLALATAAILFSQCGGCLADPWPEPDPATEESDDMAGGDDDNDDTDPLPPEPPDSRGILCSAPAPAGSEESGAVTVVGLAGTVSEGTEIVVRGSSDQEASIPVSADGSFAGRLYGVTDGEILSFAAADGDVESEPVTVPAGILVGGSVEGGGILGDGTVAPPDAEEQVAISGDGDRLVSGALVVGGNIDSSTAASTLVAAGQFDLFIGGASGDIVDLFLVVSGQQSGYTDVETVEVP